MEVILQHVLKIIRPEPGLFRHPSKSHLCSTNPMGWKEPTCFTRCNLSCSICSHGFVFFNDQFAVIPFFESQVLGWRFPPCIPKRSKGDQDICKNGAASPPFTHRWLLTMLFNMPRYSNQYIVSVCFRILRSLFGIKMYKMYIQKKQAGHNIQNSSKHLIAIGMFPAQPHHPTGCHSCHTQQRTWPSKASNSLDASIW